MTGIAVAVISFIALLVVGFISGLDPDLIVDTSKPNWRDDIDNIFNIIVYTIIAGCVTMALGQLAISFG